MKQERNRPPQVARTIQAQQEETQCDEIDYMYDYHAQMEVHEDATMDLVGSCTNREIIAIL